jgi:Tfp pilus assembly protein PilF
MRVFSVLILAVTLLSSVFIVVHRAARAEMGSPVVSADGRPLGTVSFPTSCDATVQDQLERGLALLHHMTYVQAESTFLAAIEADPDCAIAYWGTAMTLVHPLWPDVISAEKHGAGLELLRRAAAASHRSPREDGYIAALGSYYDGDFGRSEAERLAAFLKGWADLHRDYPGDPEAKLFNALALMATASPSDKTFEKQKAAGAMAEEVLAEMLLHPGAHHYIIHAYDSPPLAELALPVARSYDEVAPENSHALHMTTHIFTRRGLWPESIAFNIRAAAAAEERTPSDTVSLHHLHALDYLAYAYLQTANDAAAHEVLVALKALKTPFQNHAATAYAFAAIPVRYALERQDWATAATLESSWPDGVPWEQYPHLVALPQFARALGAAHSGDVATAKAAIGELDRLQEKAAALNMAYDWGIQVAIQKVAAEAWLAYKGGATEQALELMRQAAEMESSTEKNPVTPGEVLPARELYGDMLLDSGRYADAQREYEAALDRSPNRFNSLFGAARAAELAGKNATATPFYAKLVEICPNPTGRQLQLDHARAFLE